MYEFLEHIFHVLVEYGILIVEIVGAAIILCAAVKGFLGLIRRDP